MKRWFDRLLTLTCVLFVTGSVRADNILWSYSWTRSPLSVPSDGTGTGGISLTLGQGLPMSGNSDITAVNLSTFSSAPAGTIDHFTHSPFTLALTITDKASGQTGKTTFTGEFDGTLSPTAAGIKAIYDQSQHKLTIGANLYTVALTSFAAPGIPASTTVGSIGAHVTVANATSGGLASGGMGGSSGGGLGDGLSNPLAVGGGGGGVSVSDVPEPTSLFLAGLASPAVGLAVWRRLTKRPTTPG